MASPDDPDEIDLLWDDDPTHRDLPPAAPVTKPHRYPVEPDTKPHRSSEYLGGRESGFSEGVAQVLAALVIELRKAGLSPADIRRIRRRVQTGAHLLG